MNNIKAKIEADLIRLGKTPAKPGSSELTKENYELADKLLRAFWPTVDAAIVLVLIAKGEDITNAEDRKRRYRDLVQTHWPQIRKSLNWVWWISGFLGFNFKVRKTIEALLWAGDLFVKYSEL